MFTRKSYCFAIGEKVRITNLCHEAYDDTGVIVHIDTRVEQPNRHRISVQIGPTVYCVDPEDLIHLDEYNKQDENTMSEKRDENVHELDEKFILSLSTEPTKTFKRLEILNSDNLISERGIVLFTTFLLHSKFAEDFKKYLLELESADK